MIIKALNTFASVLDLSAMERLQEGNPCEHYPFRLFMRPGDVVEVDDKFYNLIRIQDALRLGYIEIGNYVTNFNPHLVDMSYVGTTMTQTAGEVLAMGDLVYYKDDGKVYRAKADSDATMICVGISTSSYSANSSAVLLIDGLIRNSSVFSFTVGGQASKSADRAIVYVSEAALGAVTQLRSVTSGHIVQIIGYALTSDILNFKPDYTYVEIA